MILFSPLLFWVPTTQNLGTSMADLLCGAKWVPGWYGAVWHGIVQWGVAAVAWCGVVQCGVVWCYVAWFGAWGVLPWPWCPSGFCCHLFRWLLLPLPWPPQGLGVYTFQKLALHRIAQHAQTHTHTHTPFFLLIRNLKEKSSSDCKSGGQWAPPPGREILNTNHISIQHIYAKYNYKCTLNTYSHPDRGAHSSRKATLQ